MSRDSQAMIRIRQEAQCGWCAWYLVSANNSHAVSEHSERYNCAG